MNRPMIQTSIPFQTWDLDLLIEYVLRFHHRNTRKYGGKILRRLTELAEKHHELDKVVDHFRNSINDLDIHCQKEENVLYPYIQDIFNKSQLGQKPESFHCGTVQNPIHVMMMDHSEEIDRHNCIAELTNNYQAPAGSEPEYQQALDELKMFRDYLLEHIFVENEIIFPRAIALESNNTETA